MWLTNNLVMEIKIILDKNKNYSVHKTEKRAKEPSLRKVSPTHLKQPQGLIPVSSPLFFFLSMVASTFLDTKLQKIELCWLAVSDLRPHSFITCVIPMDFFSDNKTKRHMNKYKNYQNLQGMSLEQFRKCSPARLIL